MKLILAGATGFAGGEVLRQALADASVEKVLVLTRRPLGVAHAKLKEVIVRDFLHLDDLASEFREYTACIWCLGVSQASVSKEAYVTITHDYAAYAAATMLRANLLLRFCFLSGRSADPTEQNKNLFARIKGRTERTLFHLGNSTFSFRPGYIKPTVLSGSRKDLGRFLAPIGTLIGLFNQDLSVDCDQLARCMLNVAKNGASEQVLSNQTIKHWP